MNSDVGKYSNAVKFETEVYNGVYWVPINTFGKSRYTNNDMKEISKKPITEKKLLIGNLYEAVQLFQISGFTGCIDNENHKFSNNVLWQTHKNQYESVLSNEGCCATDTNWLAYFIRDKYDFIGSFCYANSDGNGHITTYIKEDEEFYFLDMMMCRKDSQEYLCKENGIIADLLASEWSGFLYKCKNPLDFCYFNIERFKNKNRDIPFCFYMRQVDCVTATGLCLKDDSVSFYIPKCDNPIILYCDNDKGDMQIVDLPKQLMIINDN